MKKWMSVVTLMALLFPSAVLAFPFGGQTSQVVPCYNQAIYAAVGPPRGGAYIWTPSTDTYPNGAPSFAGQWLLGLAGAPYYCLVSVVPIIVWSGIAITMMGSSGGGSYNTLLNSGANQNGNQVNLNNYNNNNSNNSNNNNNNTDTFQPSPVALGSAQTVLSGLYNVYSPSLLSYNGATHMWLGGWLTAADVGADKIYRSRYSGSWSQPSQNFALGSYHVNDPSVITDPADSSRLFMYYTALNNQYTSSTDITQHNVVGLAVSSDGGSTWNDQGIVIGQNNGIDARGAWSPSALVVNGEIWVYYNTNSPGTPDIYRTRFGQTGKQVLGTDKVYLSSASDPTSETKQMTGINVDVSKQGTHYVMLINPSLTAISRYISTDGIHWHTAAQDTNPIIKAPSGKQVATPTMFTDGGKPAIFYALGSASSGHFTSIQEIKTQ